MGTPFEEIYPIFMAQVTAHTLLEMLNSDDGEEKLNKNLQFWLMSAIGFFLNCRQDLSDFDLQLEQFNITLDHMEKQILAKFMLLSYMDTYLMDENLLKQKLNSRDYRQYSEQGLIRALIDIKTQINTEAQTLLSRYSWSLLRVRDLFK